MISHSNSEAQILDEHRKNCEHQGKYAEAEIAKNRLEELKAHEEKRQEDAMRARHISDMLEIEKAHMIEFQSFNMKWNTKLQDYESQCKKTITCMKSRHENELKEYQDKISTRQRKPKFSTELLNYRKIEEHLVKSKDYAGAHKTKQRADELESIELERWEKNRKRDLTRLEKQFMSNKSQELENLKKRLQTGREELKKRRKFDLERLLQRYQNLKKEMEVRHSLERSNQVKRSKSNLKL